MLEQASDLLPAQSSEISLTGFIFNLLLSMLLASILRWVYARYGRSLSNKSQFGSNFVLLTMTTMLIITVVKSSLALSLGLVGALSVIRFRTAIKEPEELTYFFLAISIGLGLGANQTVITTIALSVILLSIIVHKKMTSNSDNQNNMMLTVKTCRGDIISILDITNMLEFNS